MKQFLVYAILIWVLLGLTIVSPPIYGARPNFLFLFAVLYAFDSSDQLFLWMAFFCGMSLDIFSGNFFGAYTLSLLIVTLLINYTTISIFKSEASVQSLSVIITFAYIVFVGSAYAINSFAYQLGFISHPIAASYLVNKLLFDLLFNLVFAGPVYWLTIYADKLTLKFKQHQV